MYEEIDEIEKRINSFKEEEKERSHPSNVKIYQKFFFSLNLFSEGIAGLLCGFLIGYYLDNRFETSPLFLCIFLIMGAVAGLLNIVKALHRYEQKEKIKEEQEKALALKTRNAIDFQEQIKTKEIKE